MTFYESSKIEMVQDKEPTIFFIAANKRNMINNHVISFMLFFLYSDVFIKNTIDFIKQERLMKATTVRMDDQLLQRVDGIAKSQSRSRSWIITQALERFVNYEEWFKLEVEQGLAEAERGDIAGDAEVKNAFKKWGVNAS
jgi:predicted transcriptional regulator